ncbi:hypothetical protein [Streptococcus sp.]|uniref:hypothetical protein n=1 Tax=Streptococcus sp. TaxID=1306 RepID=UPI00359F65D6
MKLYIKGDFKKKITFGYEELAHKMWTERINGKELSISHSGNDETLQEENLISLYHNKWLNDNRWSNSDIVALHSFLKMENISLEFELARVSDYRETGEYLRIASSHKDILTVDKRAFYIMAIEVATALDGIISEDDRVTWIRVDEFKERHADVLLLSFEEAHEMGLKEVFNIECVKDPIWAELKKQRAEYIKIHGERIWEDEKCW